MTVPHLPDDCIYHILKYLQGCHSTLFKCLLVNRFWCKATIPLLYANPFDNFRHYIKRCSIILTLILCLNKQEILQIKNQLILIDIHDIHGIDIDIDYEPLFKYPKYIENYDGSAVNFMISQWFGYLNYPCQWKDLCTNVIPIVKESILFQCDNIKQLSLYLYKFHNIHLMKTFASLSKLNSLTLVINALNETGLEFLNNVENYCLNLRELKIFDTKYTIKGKLCSIIQKQNNLQVFRISSPGCESSLLENILISLETQKHSLVCIEFGNIYTLKSVSNILHLCNLKCLKFDRPLSLMQCEILKFSSFQLRELYIESNTWDSDALSLIIKYLGASLQKLVIENLKLPVIKNILTFCPNLITLSINIERISSSVLPYFNNLKIRILYLYFIGCHDIDETFINLANHIPIGIKEVSIKFNYSQLSRRFKKFLENCHDGLEIINLVNYINSKLLKAILVYAERINNSLKLLRIKHLEKKRNSKVSELFDQIRAKGVQIVDFIE